MKAELKKRWSDAIRTCKYRQARFALVEIINGETCACAQGVLGLEAGYAIGQKESNSECDIRMLIRPDGFGIRCMLSEYACAELGLSPHVSREVARMSDGGFTAEQIANYIDQWVEVTE